MPIVRRFFKFSITKTYVQLCIDSFKEVYLKFYILEKVKKSCPKECDNAKMPIYKCLLNEIF